MRHYLKSRDPAAPSLILTLPTAPFTSAKALFEPAMLVMANTSVAFRNVISMLLLTFNVAVFPSLITELNRINVPPSKSISVQVSVGAPLLVAVMVPCR